MQMVGRRAFDRYGRYVARRHFQFDGEQFEPGDPFDIRGAERRAERLYRLRYIQPAPDGVSVVVNGTHETGLRIVKRSPGWYDVLDASGTALNDRAIRYPEAEALAQR